MGVIYEDTRNRPGKHKLKNEHFEKAGYKVIRTKLYVGDYMFVGGKISIDSKQSIAELHGNLTADHARFRRECTNARDAGIQLHVLIENEHGIASGKDLVGWVEPPWAMAKRKRAKRPIDGVRLLNVMSTMYRRYGVLFWFCPPEEAGAKIIEILEGGAPHGDG